MTAARLPPSVFVVLVASAAALPAAFTLAPAVDPDAWWHLRVGQLVWETGTVPETDPFSRLSRERLTPWVAYSWLFDLGLYGAYSAGGLTGVMVARSLLAATSAAAVLGFVARRVGPTPAAAVAVGLSAAALMPFARERPWHVTITFTVLTLDVVLRLRDGEQVRWAWLLPAAFALWANLHIQFVLGWLVLGLGCLFPGAADRRKLLCLTAACGLATFVNPYHARLLVVVWDYATQTAPLREVQELASPEIASVWTWAVAALVVGAVAALARRRPVDWFGVALLAVGVILAMRMRRDLWFGAVAAGFQWQWLAARRGRARGQPADATAPHGGTLPPALGSASRLTAAVFATFLLVRLVHLAGFGPPSDFAAAVAADYPEGAAATIRDRRLAGPLFNPFDWGGYLIWALPDHPVSIDGRTNLYGSERISRAINTWVCGPGWDTDPELISANLVVAPARGVLAGQLRERETEWAVASEDATAVVFVRR